MAKPEDIASLSVSMRTAYGQLWKNDSVESLQVWANALAPFDQTQIAVAMHKCLSTFIDYPPTLPQYLELIRESVPLLPGSPEASKAMADVVLAYTKPQGPRNPNGNPSNITLPDSISKLRQGELIGEYRNRISDAVTLARYPALSVEHN